MLYNIPNILYIGPHAERFEFLTPIFKRWGAENIRSCRKKIEAQEILTKGFLANLIIEDVGRLDDYLFLEYHQQTLLKTLFFLPPTIALIELTDESLIQKIKDHKYFDYFTKPLNLNLFEHKVINTFVQSKNYDNIDALHDFVESEITKKDLTTARTFLLPTMTKKKDDLRYLSLYASILYEEGRYEEAQKIVTHVTARDDNNLKAKNILTKILIKTNQEGIPS